MRGGGRLRGRWRGMKIAIIGKDGILYKREELLSKVIDISINQGLPLNISFRKGRINLVTGLF